MSQWTHELRLTRGGKWCRKCKWEGHTNNYETRLFRTLREATDWLAEHLVGGDPKDIGVCPMVIDPDGQVRMISEDDYEGFFAMVQSRMSELEPAAS